MTTFTVNNCEYTVLTDNTVSLTAYHNVLDSTSAQLLYLENLKNQNFGELPPDDSFTIPKKVTYNSIDYVVNEIGSN